MKRLIPFLAVVLCLFSCNQYNTVMKSADYEYKYEAAKEYFVKGQYSRASYLLGELVATMKGTMCAEESLYMLAMSDFCNGDYESAYSFFKKYYQSYPKGIYVEYARFYAGRSLFESIPDPRLDQSNTMSAVRGGAGISGPFSLYAFEGQGAGNDLRASGQDGGERIQLGQTLL